MNLSDSAVGKFERALRNMMLTDKDFIMKSSRAFVSFVRSFKEHKLSNILKFKNMDVPGVARSFFLFKLPIIKEFKELEMPEIPLATEEELKKFTEVEYLNKNQETMIKKKIELAIEGSKLSSNFRTRKASKESRFQGQTRERTGQEEDQVQSS